MPSMQLQHGTDWPQPPTPHNKLVVHLTHQMFAHFICPILTYIIPADKMITSFIVTSFNNDYFVYHYWLNYWHTLISKNTPASPPIHHNATTEHRRNWRHPPIVQRHMHGPTCPSGKRQIRSYHRCVGRGSRYQLLFYQGVHITYFIGL